jgi:SAM-dependent methyltransferase
MADGSWDGGRILETMWRFREACVIGAAAELEIFNLLGAGPLTSDEIVARLKSNARATRMLLDAVAALGLLIKKNDRYELPVELHKWLRDDSATTVGPMICHSMGMLRSWSQLARVVKDGGPAERIASIRGAEVDRAAFVAAMHSVSGPVAKPVVNKLGALSIKHLLDVGGASGTWTLAFLEAVPEARATIFDLPDAIEQARARIGSPFAKRIELVTGDFYADELPRGADYAWISAIAHQHDRRHNRELFAKVYRALAPGGKIGIRDFVMESDRIRPRDGALFAINMLVNTETGGTFTLAETTEDLIAAGFKDVRLAVPSDEMHAIIEAVKKD